MRALPLLMLLASPAFSHPLDREAGAVIDLFYNLEFEKAAQAAEDLAKRHPGHPIGPFYRGIVYYQRFLVEDPRRPETLESFERESRAAIEAGEALLRSKPAEANYYLGVAKGFRARVLAARRKYVKAVPEGLAAIKHLRKALELDPDFEDAYLGLGMYYYFTARIPAGAKPFAYLFGVRGDREKGLEYLARTADGKGPARWEARSMLSSVYTLEKDWEKADGHLAELMARYPRNPLYRQRRVYVSQRAQWWSKALELSDPDGDWTKTVPEPLRQLALNYARYRAAETYIVTGRPKQAAPLLAALDEAKLSPALKDWVAIRRANLLDSDGRRADARALYRAVSHRRAKGVAEEFLKEPYPGGPKGVMPWLGVETPN